MGFVFQTFNLLSALSAQENVMLPMALAGKLSPAQRKSRASNLLSLVGLSSRKHHVPSQLSGGEQQRVTIARAIANEPDILYLDEPTGDLDSNNTMAVLDLLWFLNQTTKLTLIMVTHDAALKAFSHRAVYMRDGKISHVDTIAPVVRHRAFAGLMEGMKAAGLECLSESPTPVSSQPGRYATGLGTAMALVAAALTPEATTALIQGDRGADVGPHAAEYLQRGPRTCVRSVGSYRIAECLTDGPVAPPPVPIHTELSPTQIVLAGLSPSPAPAPAASRLKNLLAHGGGGHGGGSAAPAQSSAVPGFTRPAAAERYTTATSKTTDAGHSKFQLKRGAINNDDMEEGTELADLSSQFLSAVAEDTVDPRIGRALGGHGKLAELDASTGDIENPNPPAAKPEDIHQLLNRD